MRGKRGPRGITDRAGKIDGKNYTGDPAGVVKPWGGGPAGVSTPAVGQYPTIPLAIDDDDDGSTTMDRIAAATKSGRKRTRNTTKARLRWPLMILANFIAWLMDVVSGTRSVKSLTADGTGGASVVEAPGRITASENMLASGSIEAGTFVQAGTDVSAGGNVIAAGNSSAGGTMTSGARTSKQIWIPGHEFVVLNAGDARYLGKGCITCNSGGPIDVACALSQYLRIGAPAARITRITGYWNANATKTMTLYQAPAAATWPSNPDTVLASQASANSSGTVWIADMTGLAVVADATHTLWLDVPLATSDAFYGVLVTFEDAVL